MTHCRLALAYRDPAKALRFWVGRCGFRVEEERVAASAAVAAADGMPGGGSGVAGTAPVTIVRRGPIEIRIVDAASLPTTSPLGRRIGKATGGSVRVELVLDPAEKIADWFVRLEQAGADIAEPLGEWTPGERSFSVSDPGGYLVAFVQPVAGRGARLGPSFVGSEDPEAPTIMGR